MKILDNLNPKFRIDAYEDPSTEDEIVELRKVSSIPVPDDYLGMIRRMASAEILITEYTYIRIWGAADAVEMNDANAIQRYFPVSLAIGDDEGGNALVLTDGKHGFGLYKCNFGDLDPKSAEFIAATLADFLIRGVGLDVFP